MEDECPDTPKVCESCGGDWMQGCHWCSDGYMDAGHMARWKAFRTRMRTMSGTYSLFQSLIEGLADRLIADGTAKSYEVAQGGLSALARWMEAEPDTHEREEASKDVSKFHGLAVDRLSKRPGSP